MMNRKIPAIIYNTVRGNFFTPAFFIVIALLLAIPYWCSHMAGDGTLEGKFKVFITYSFIMGALILTATNISLSCLTISGEWKKKTLFLLDVKPVRRWEIITGKWLGILVINLFLVLAFLISLTLCSILLSHNLSKSFPEERDIFVTYREVSPASTGEYEEVKPPGIIGPLERTPSPPSEKETYAVPPGGRFKWNFKGIPTSSEMYLVYRFYTSEKQKKEVLGYWLIEEPSQRKPMELVSRSTSEKVRRLPLPLEAIGNGGELSITYINIDPSNVSILFPKKDLKIRYPWGNYWVNLLEGGVNIFVVVAFISAVGILFSCLVSTLTAVLSTSVLVFISYLHDFVEMISNSLISEAGVQGATGLLHHISYSILKLSTFLLPPLNESLPHSYIGDFLLLPAPYLGTVAIRIVLLGALPALILAMVYLSRRELGVPNE